MKRAAWMVAVVMALGISGCAQKSESEKMMDHMHKDAKKASDQMKKEINNF